MSAKITALVITLLINLVAGVIVLFSMLLALNGFSEEDGSYGLGAYIVLGLGVTVLMSAGAFLLVQVLLKRGFQKVTSALIAIPIFSVIGVVLKIVCGIIGVLIADYVRVNF
jgi:hypothetical protein